MSRTAKRLIIIAVVVIIAALLAWAAGSGEPARGGVPLIAWGVIAAFAIQWIVFIPSYLAQTERFFDLTGSLTYIGLTVALALLAGADLRGWILADMVVIWAARLGTFLFRRVSSDGGDSRFDERKKDPLVFFIVWTLQGLWVTVTALAAWTAITAERSEPIGVLAVVGILVYAFGLTIEAIADAQKSRFRRRPGTRGEFIDEGLWSRSRHPNYFGEITLWVGVALVAAAVLSGWQWIVLISPLFVILQLTKISGVRLQEQQAVERWGERADYQHYRNTTPVLIPRLTARPPQPAGKG